MSGSLIAAIVFGVLLGIVGFAHPIGPGLMLAAETPFDAMAFTLFGVTGNFVTFIPIIILLIKVNPAHWGEAFLGTRIQQFMALFIVALLVCHAMAIPTQGIGEIFEWLRKVTLFLLTGVFAFSMRQTKHLPLLVKTMVVAMAVFVVFAMLDFYLGIQLLPVKAGRMETAALETEFQKHLATNWRFSGPGFPVNRFANYLLVPIFLGVGWFMRVKNPLERLFALGFTSVLAFGELLTVSRAAILGMAVGGLILLPMAFRLRVQQVIGITVIGAAVGALAWWGVSLTSADEVLATRFELEHLGESTGGRLTRLVAALKIWAEHPFFGTGWGMFKHFSPEFIGAGGKGAHNGYMNVLAEAGLLGFIPLVILTVAVVRRNLTRIGHLSDELEFWRPYFFCGLVAEFITVVFNDYLWERYLWGVSFGFAVVLEQRYHGARAKEARARLDEMRALPDRGSSSLTAQVRPS